jgi:hypothetical protein
MLPMKPTPAASQEAKFPIYRMDFSGPALPPISDMPDDYVASAAKEKLSRAGRTSTAV